MKKRYLPFVLLAVGCTPAQRAAWLEWHANDPEAAVQYAKDGCPGVDSCHVTSGGATTDRTSQSGDVWDRLARCESGGNWGYNGGSGYDGGLQFLPATWRAYGGQEFAEYAWQASREEQIAVAQRVLDDVGWGAWPACSRKLGLR